MIVFPRIFGSILVVVAAILETLAPFLTTLGIILVILGTPGYLLEALGAQRRPAEKQTR